MNRFLSRSQPAFAALALTAVLTTGCALGPMNLSGPDSTPTKVALNLKGNVHGGQQPVSYSTIQLWAVGSGSYGAAAANLMKSGSYYPGGAVGCVSSSISITGFSISGNVLALYPAGSVPALKPGEQLTLAGFSGSYTSLNGTYPITSGNLDEIDIPVSHSNVSSTSVSVTGVPICYPTVVTDASGNFTLTGDYTLPGTAAQIYVTATGGNPGLAEAGTPPNNTAIKLAAPLGLSTGLTSGTEIVINELTTAAMAFAANQFFTPTFGSGSTDSFGATTGGQIGLTNAFATAGSLVNVSTGQPAGTQVLGNSTTGTVTATPDTAKVALIADILASCVNDASPTGTHCAQLFPAVTPTSATAPTDTLQAAVYMALNPTSTNTTNMNTLFGLASDVGAYTPYYASITSAPSDWTIAISYGLATTATGGTYILSEPQWFAFDATGNVYIMNYSNNLTELSPTGRPVYSSPANLGVAVPYSVVVDPSGNVWFGNGYATGSIGANPGKQLIKYSGGTFTEYATTNIPYALASDGKGDIFISEVNGVEELVAGVSAVTPITTGITTAKYATIAVDSNYNLWITAGGTGTTIYEIPYSAGAYGTPIPQTSTALTAGEPLAIDGSNNVWVANYVSGSAGTLAKIPAATPASGASYTVTGATGGLEGVAIDGGGNVWTSNYSTGTNAFYEISNAGVEISPSTGWAHTTHDAKAIAVDPSGNVWVGGTATQTSAMEMVELVGGAVPVVTPIAAGLPTTAGGTNLLGSKP